MKGSFEDFMKYLNRKTGETMFRLMALLKSKTFWGSIVGTLGYLLGQETIGISEIVTAGGAVFAAIGIKDNFSKVQQGKVDPPRGADYNPDGI